MTARSCNSTPEMSAAVQRIARSWVRRLNLSESGSEALGAWFLGPKAENEALLLRLMTQAVNAHAETRRRYYRDDPRWLTSERQQSAAYVQSAERLESELAALLEALDGSVPFYSYRYQGHMLWDVTLPSVLGYVAALFYNQNNVAAEASPVTTWLEMLVGDDLCRMLGYYTLPRDLDTGDYGESDPQRTVAWGHITSCGTVANCEALWAARNVKFMAAGIAAALKRELALAPARGLSVRRPNGEERILIELDTWELLNLEADVVIALPERVKTGYRFDASVDVDDILGRYTVQHLGLAPFLREFAPDARDPVFLTPATAHYSWPKGASLVGLGRNSVLGIEVDLDARLDVAALRTTLDECLRTRTPVIMVVAVLGTTEQSAIDPLAAILEERERYRRLGLEFWLHVDAAWGGYFASMIRPADDDGAARSVTKIPRGATSDANSLLYGPDIVMSEYVEEQYCVLGQADSITIDPHKAGYVPYPAGGLCYRNGAMRHLVAFTAPVVYHGGIDPAIGVYGIEGSKPGAAPTAVYLSHRVIRTDQSGYGRILGRCLWNSKRLYCELVTMAQEDDLFTVVPLQRLPSERNPGPRPAHDVQTEVRRIRQQIVPKTNEELIAALNGDPELLAWFRNLGSDQLILSYAFNFKVVRGGERVLNTDVELMNYLNQTLFRRLSLARPHADLPDIPLFVTASELDIPDYGSRLVGDFKRRLGVDPDTDAPVHFLISTTMDPWLSDTEAGSFIPKLIEELRDEVRSMIANDPLLK